MNVAEAQFLQGSLGSLQQSLRDKWLREQTEKQREEERKQRELENVFRERQQSGIEKDREDASVHRAMMEDAAKQTLNWKQEHAKTQAGLTAAKRMMDATNNALKAYSEQMEFLNKAVEGNTMSDSEASTLAQSAAEKLKAWQTEATKAHAEGNKIPPMMFDPPKFTKKEKPEPSTGSERKFNKADLLDIEATQLELEGDSEGAAKKRELAERLRATEPDYRKVARDETDTVTEKVDQFGNKTTSRTSKVPRKSEPPISDVEKARLQEVIRRNTGVGPKPPAGAAPVAAPESDPLEQLKVNARSGDQKAIDYLNRKKIPF